MTQQNENVYNWVNETPKNRSNFSAPHYHKSNVAPSYLLFVDRCIADQLHNSFWDIGIIIKPAKTL